MIETINKHTDQYTNRKEACEKERNRHKQEETKLLTNKYYLKYIYLYIYIY